MTPSDNYFTISPHNLALLHSTLLHSYPVPLNWPKFELVTLRNILFTCYFLQVIPYHHEIPVKNSFQFTDIFNDMAFNCFLPKDSPTTPSLWADNPEPCYDHLDDVEIIQTTAKRWHKRAVYMLTNLRVFSFHDSIIYQCWYSGTSL